MHRVQLIRERIKTRSLPHACTRLIHIAQRYGSNARQFSATLTELITLTARYHCTPTIPVTAMILKRHADLFRSIRKMNVELGIHGLRHIDYSHVGISTLNQHLQEAVMIFKEEQIPGTGFRFPYLRQDDARIRELTGFHFQWDSSKAVVFDVLEDNRFPADKWQVYQRFLEMYQPLKQNEETGLPFFIDNMVEIPVALPDDDILVDQLGIRNQDDIFAVWSAMLDMTIQASGCLVLQVHPERFHLYKNALENLLRKASSENIWIASLGSIADWWRKKWQGNGIVTIQKLDRNRFRMQYPEEDGMVCMLMKKGRMVRKGRNITVECSRKPVVGLAPDTSGQIRSFLQTNGYFWENSDDANACTLYIPARYDRKEDWQFRLRNALNTSEMPLLGYARWPDNRPACLAVSGDIDCVTYWDFFTRFHD